VCGTHPSQNKKAVLKKGHTRWCGQAEFQCVHMQHLGHAKIPRATSEEKDNHVCECLIKQALSGEETPSVQH
jgi:hypothetical protein